MKPSQYIAKGWCKEVSAKAVTGGQCKPRSSKAAKWCIYGAIERAYRDKEKQKEVISSLLNANIGESIAAWNDRQTSKKTVIELLQSIGE